MLRIVVADRQELGGRGTGGASFTLDSGKRGANEELTDAASWGPRSKRSIMVASAGSALQASFRIRFADFWLGWLTCTIAILGVALVCLWCSGLRGSRGANAAVE